MAIGKHGIIVPAIVSGLCLAAGLGCGGKKGYAAPYVTGFSPAQTTVGGTVVITGLDFSDIGSVSFGGQPAAWYQTNSSTMITAGVPDNAITGTISVQNPGGVGASTGTLIVLPVITSIEPTSGAAGTEVTLTGSGFFDATALTIGGEVAGAPASSVFTYYNPNQINVVVGANASTGPVVLTASGVTYSGPTFTVSYGQPVITGLSLAQAAVGASVVISGSGFDAVESVTFGGVAATSFTVNSGSQITAIVPASAVTGAVVVQNPTGQGTSSASLSIVAAPTVSSISPTSGPAGTPVTISGTGLDDPAAAVVIGGVAATVSAHSAGSLTATVGAGSSTGAVVVTVSGITVTGPVFTVN